MMSGQAGMFEIMIKNLEDVCTQREKHGLPAIPTIDALLQVCREALSKAGSDPEKATRFIQDLERRLANYVRRHKTDIPRG